MRRLGVALLCLYAGLLVLSAWPSEVRPRILDGAHHLARAALGAVAIRGGMGIFEPAPERIQRVIRNDCVRVRGLGVGRAPQLLYPPGGACRLDGFHPGIPAEEWILRSLLLRARAPLSQAVIGDFYCHSPDREGPAFEEVEVLWRQPWLDVDTGEQGRGNVILYRWRCAPPAITLELRGPSDAQVQRLAPGD